MAEFREGNSRVLISTDVWARGLDVQQVRGARGGGGGKCAKRLLWQCMCNITGRRSDMWMHLYGGFGGYLVQRCSHMRGLCSHMAWIGNAVRLFVLWTYETLCDAYQPIPHCRSHLPPPPPTPPPPPRCPW
jgi:hypothetical protein